MKVVLQDYLTVIGITTATSMAWVPMEHIVHQQQRTPIHIGQSCYVPRILKLIVAIMIETMPKLFVVLKIN